MDSKGFLRKSLSSTGEVIVISLEATGLVQEQMDRIGALPSAMIHLGQALMTALLLQSLGDPTEEDRVQTEWLAKGDFGNLFAEAIGTGRARGTIGNPQASAESLGKDLGPGILQVRRYHSGSKSTGMVTSTGDVSTDLVEYLERSEQRSCGSNLSVKIEWDESRAGSPLPFRVRSARAFLVHVLPQSSDLKRDQILRRWDGQIRALGALSQWGLSDDAEIATREMMQMLSGEEHSKTLFAREVELYCTCSEDRAARAVAFMESTSETPDLLEAHTVRCEFCGLVYKVGH